MLDVRRRCFIRLLGGAAATWPLAARAQQPVRVYRLGLLTPTSGPTANHQALDDALTRLGYREGRNLVTERRYAAGNDRLPVLAADLVRANVDVIVTESYAAAAAAKNATTTIPIVMATAGDPVATGLVASLARPGGNLTGNSIITTDLASKKVERLHELKPDARRLGHLGDEQIKPDRIAFHEVQSAASAFGIEVMFFNAPFFYQTAPDAFERAFFAMAAARVDAIFVAEFVTYLEARNQIIELAARHRLPAVYGRREFAEAGGLLSYGSNFVENFRHAAVFIDKIFKGAKPADLPVEQPTKFELVINLKTARTLGIAIPPTLLAIADEVIE
jgi:putative tryptophan/tyrosine transport system substrate-binding protein